MKKIIFILMLLSAKLTTAQISNGGFEVWDTTYTHIYSSVLSSTYGVPNPLGGVPNHWTFLSGAGICQTTDSYSGNYSLILHNWYGYAREWATYHDSINYSPSFLQGYFKYIKGAHPFAQGEAMVTLTRFNGTSNDTVAWGSYLFDTTAFYIPFQITLNYVSFLAPDSITIYIANATGTSGWSTVVSNLLYLDDLTLSDSPLSIENINTMDNPVTIFPNPSASEFHIQNNSTEPFHFTLYNSLGEKILNESFNEKISSINISGSSPGIYFYKVTDHSNKITTGKIIKQ